MKTKIDLWDDKGGKKIGEITYEEETKVIEVIGDHPALKKVKRYMGTTREFMIPVSQELDDYRIDKAKPGDQLTYFELALCTLHANTGVWVDWKSQRSN